jgi:hypothetical protein
MEVFSGARAVSQARAEARAMKAIWGFTQVLPFKQARRNEAGNLSMA